MDHGAVNAASEGRTKHPKPCKSSAIICCQAMTACGLSARLSATVSTEDAFPADNQLPTDPGQAALSRITPPDPPPPKA